MTNAELWNLSNPSQSFECLHQTKEVEEDVGSLSYLLGKRTGKVKK